MGNGKSAGDEKDRLKYQLEAIPQPNNVSREQVAADEEKRQKNFFTLAFLLRNPAGFSFFLSSLFLVSGALHNLGLFLLLDLQLVTVLPLTDHISTSIYVSWILVALGIFMAIPVSILLSVLWWAAFSMQYAFFRFLKLHLLVSTLFVLNFVLAISIFSRVHLRGEPLVALVTVGVFLFVIGSVSFVLHIKYAESESKNVGLLRFGGVVLLLYLIPFQVGVSQSLGVAQSLHEWRPGFDRYLGERHFVNDSAVHLLRAGSTGVFYVVHSSEDVPESIRFEPWSKVENFGYRPSSPPSASER